MKRLLFLDDDENRHFRFSQMIEVLSNQLNRKDIAVIHNRTATECIQSLKLDPVYDAVFLDHDLDLNTYDHPSEEETGMEVVDFIDRVMDRDKCPRNIIIHSHNEAAAVLMENNLKIAGLSSTITRIEFPSFFAHTDKEFLDLLVELIKE